MRKKLLALFTIMAVSVSLQAQTNGGPDQFGYIWRNSLDANGPAYTWVEIDGLPGTMEVTGLLDDNTVGPFALPAPFHYYWYDVNNFKVGSNGYITFSSNTNIASGTNGFPAIPTPGSTNNDFIAAFMTDLVFDGTPGRCYYYATPNNDSLIITYDSVPFWSPPSTFVGTNTFQIILDYSDSSIVVNYQEQIDVSSGTVGAISTGIENNSGNIGLQHLYDVYPVAGTSVKYYYPQTITLAINDASTSYNDNSTNGAIFLSKSGTPYTLVTEVQNTGNQILNPFNVQSQIRNAANNALVVSNLQPTDTLTPGQTQIMTMPNVFQDTVAGTFIFRTDTQLPGDATPSNNRKDVEVVVLDTTQTSIEMAYENATSSTGTISWTGGDGGAAVYMKPPFTPYVLTAVKAFVAADANNFGYHMMVYDDDGGNGDPGTLLDSVFVAGGSFTLNTYTTTLLTAPITKTSGGFYVLWYMGGDGTALGTVTTAPISNRTYEILGSPLASSFAAYRERETEDVMLRAVISKVVGINENEKNSLFSNLYPNPVSSDYINIDFDVTGLNVSDLTVEIYDVAGRVISAQSFSAAKGTLAINSKELKSGMYLCRILAGNSTVTRNFSVVK
jgi:hypothetical protein